MKNRTSLSLLLFALGFFQLPGAHADTPPAATRADSWAQQVAAISSGSDNTARGEAIGRRLQQMGLESRKEAFEIDGKQGTNLVADLGGPAGAPLLLIGAHYDRVAVGHGATDNASGVAAVLELAQALKAQPLAHHRVQVVFWDLEEAGLLGSRAWVATPDREKPALYVNFDVFGWGSTLWMMTPEQESPLVPAIRVAIEGSGTNLSVGQQYPPTDHLAFLKAGWPAVSFSRVAADEVEPILAVFAGQHPDPMPKVMQVIHSPQDTSEALDKEGLDDSLHVLESGLRLWDTSTASAAP